MAETIIVACPECKTKIKAPADAVGKKARCKADGCGAVFVIKAPAPAKAAAAAAREPAKPAPAPAAKGGDEDDDAAPVAYGVTATDDVPRCPHCAKEMGGGAIVCVNCGYNTRSRTKANTRKTYEVTFADYLVWHLPTMACFLVIAVLVTLGTIVSLNAEKWTAGFLKNDDGSWILKPGFFMLYAWVGAAAIIWPTGRFMLKRLFFHFKPPEEEKR